MRTSVKIAVIGLTGPGGVIAAGLQAAGADVVGFDSAKIKRPPVALADSVEAAVAVADVVLSINSLAVAARVAESVAAALKPGAVYADLNNGTPALKRRLAAILPAGSFVDVAVLKPGEDTGIATPMEVAGEKAAEFIHLMNPYGMDLRLVSAYPGEAAARQQIRGILTKGMAAVATDALWAAKSLGLEAWAIEEFKNEFDALTGETLQGYLNDTGKHPKVRSVELTDLAEMLAEANYDSTMLSGMGLTFSHVMHGRKIPYADLSDD